MRWSSFNSARLKAYSLLLVLLLGSYDEDTKRLLNDLKYEIARVFGGENVYAYLLDEVEVYGFEEGFAIAEFFAPNRASLHVFNHSGEPLEEFQVEVDDRREVGRRLEEELSKREGFEVKVSPYSVFDKLDLLFQLSQVVLVIRDREETRGGEIAELIYGLMRGMGSKVCLLKRNGVPLSSMLLEFLDKWRVNLRSYRNVRELKEEALRYVRYRVDEYRRSIGETP